LPLRPRDEEANDINSILRTKRRAKQGGGPTHLPLERALVIPREGRNLEINAGNVELNLIKQTADMSFNTGSKGLGKDFGALGVLRKAICANQGDIVEHIYWGAELHKRLRAASEPAEINKLVDAIANDLPDIFQRSWRLTVEHLSNYFKLTHSSKFLPRMCIKDTIERNGTKHVIDIFRENGGRMGVEHPIDQNTGFHSVEKDGRFFLCNDIPTSAKNNDYINPRLNQRAAKKYRPPSRVKKILRRSDELDHEWAECWNDFSREKNNSSSCYKSTLIVPMTLINNPLGKEFVRTTGVGKSNRSIYGFLCFDHPQINYFHEGDINVGYIFADLLSFYQINQHSITTHSATFAKKISEMERTQP